MTAKVRSQRNMLTFLLLVLVTLNAACSSKKDTASADLDAINALHSREIEATKRWDVDSLASLWSDDVVTLSQGARPLIGKDSNRASILTLQQESRDLKLTDYIMSFNEVKIVGNWAFEWGTYS